MNLDFSLIDANINRAKEGTRVLEDFCRFVLRNQGFFVELKKIRHELDKLEFYPASCLILRSRDLGQGEVVQEEYSRYSSWDIIRSSSRRTEESLRVLEEFAKIYNRESAYQFENLRYKIYELELKILMQTPHFWLRKYFEDGVVYPISDSADEIIWLVEHGAKIIQLRDKESSRADIYKKAKYLCEYLKNREEKRHKALLIIDDDIEMASVLPVAGVHLGQDDGKIEQTRKILGCNKIIGKSNHSLEQIKKSAEDGADYLSVGPVFATPTKEGRPAVGLEVVKQAAKIICQPWLAIGGINKENINEIKNVGAKNFAVVRSAKEFFN